MALTGAIQSGDRAQVIADTDRADIDWADIDWIVSDDPVPYDSALGWMTERAAAVADGAAREAIWLLQHPPLYTAGTSADPRELLDPRFPVYAAGRGGRYTYHGPGQRIVYLIIDLGRRGRDVRCFVHAVEGWMIAALARLGVAAHRSEGRIGIWTGDEAREAKIGAIGIRVRRWVTLHGFSINVDPDLSHFSGIVPCGIADGVTSLAALGRPADTAALDDALRAELFAFLQSPGLCRKIDTIRLSTLPMPGKGGRDPG
jgi:lipoyl(octanoyl) transferase